jgi:hypothetical protein
MLRNFMWLANSYEALTRLRDALPSLSAVASPVFHRDLGGFHWVFLPIASCLRLPFHISRELGSVTYSRIDLRNIPERLFSLALSQ